MIRVAFWNVNRKNLGTQVCEIAKSMNVDVFVLIENYMESQELLDELQKKVSRDFFIPQCSPGTRFHCFSRRHALDLSELHSGFRTSVRKLKFQTHTILLSLVHGVDMKNYDIEERQSLAQELASDFRLVKENHKTDKLIAIGDFNMNPFDRGMNLALGLNAMMTKKCASRGKRKYLKKAYDFYYNPMWSYLGDLSEGPPGTIYDTSSRGLYGWSMLDQVILSHSVLDFFGSVKILSMAGSTSLLNSNGRPDSKKASDHLPIMLELKEISNV